jgi:vacuolar protein sorting-associated protein 11
VTVALSATVAHLAIGLGDGTVILYRHLDQSIASSTSLTSLPKARTVHESPTEPITGLGFREPTGDMSGYLYVVTTNRVLSYLASGRGDGASATMVDEIGTGLGCTTMDSEAKDIIKVISPSSVLIRIILSSFRLLSSQPPPLQLLLLSAI